MGKVADSQRVRSCLRNIKEMKGEIIMLKEFKHLTEKDLKDGQEIMELIESLDDDAKVQAKIYLSALSDRCNFIGGKIA